MQCWTQTVYFTTHLAGAGGGRGGGGVGRHFTVPQMIPKENWDWVAPKLAGHHVNFIITKSHIKSEILLLK